MRIFLCGDIMTGRGVDQILFHPVPYMLHENYVKDARDYVSLAERSSGKIPRKVGDDYIWGDALSIWRERKPDLKIINLETAITTNDSFYDKGINYRMHPENASVLSAAGIDICVLANNHILDWEPQGLKDTISVLDKNNIKHTGAGNTLADAQAPAVFENNEGRVLVFSLCHISSGVPMEWAASGNAPGVFLIHMFNDENIQRIRSVIEKYKEQNDVIVASIHWGSNWGYEVPTTMINFAHALIDVAGVHILHGHSSHHPRPIEIYKGKPIFYGCGDFLNDYEGIGGNEEFRPDLCLMYFINIKTKPFKLQRLDLNCMKINRFRLNKASSEEANWMHDMLSKICGPFLLKLNRLNGSAISVEV